MVVLFLASIAIFGVLRLTPGSPAAVLAGPSATPETIAAITGQLGLDQALPQQYLRWLGGLFSGHLGTSYVVGAPISTLIQQGAGNTLELTLSALILAIIGGGLLGTLGAVSRGRVTGSVLRLVNTLSFAVPTFVSGVVLVAVFAVRLPVFPPGGHVSILQYPITALRYIALPAICLAIPVSAVIARYLETALRQALEEDYVRTATAKGLTRRAIVVSQALPNALPSVVTVIGIQVGQLLGGALIVEAIFAWPGLGRLILTAVVGRDYLLVQDLLLLAVALFVVLQTATDILHAALDPRLRREA